MSPRAGRAPSALRLIVLAAGLNIYSTSTSISTTSNIIPSVRTGSTDQMLLLTSNITADTIKATAKPATLSLTTALRTDRITMSVSDAPSSTPDTTSSTANLSQPSTGLQNTEHMSTTVMSTDGSATTNIYPAETSATATSSVMSVSPTSSSLPPKEHTSAGVTQLSSIEVSSVPMTSKKPHTEGTTSGETTKEPISPSPVEKLTSSQGTSTEPISPSPVEKLISSQGTSASKATVESSSIGSTTFSSGVTIQEVQQALSSGSIAAITVTVIAVVLLVFGIAAFLKIRRSSYGRLFDDHDYGSWGNYSNPLYDDS